MKLFKLLFLIPLFFSLSHSDDLCYEDPTEGFYMSGFIPKIKNSIPIKYTGDGTSLENVNIEYAISGFDMSFSQDIGIDGDIKTLADDSDEAELDATFSTNFGVGMPSFSAFDKGINYDLGTMNNSDVTEVWSGEFFITAFMDSFFSTTKLFSEYTKDGVDYRVIINPCETSSYDVAEVEINDKSTYSPVTDENMTFTVTVDGSLSPDISDTVYIHYQTEDVTAIDGTDYIGVEGTLEIPASYLPTTVDINVTIKALASGYFNLVLDNAYGARINDGIGQGSIVDTFALCYTEGSVTDYCENPIAGLYYGKNQNAVHACTTQTLIVNRNLSEPLSDTLIYKLYDDNATEGTCDTTLGSCSGPAPISTSDTDSAYSDFGSGYTFDIGEFPVDSNMTIEDSDTHDPSASITDIMLFASYTSKGLDYERRIFSCASGAVDIVASGSVDIVNDWVDDATYNNGTHYIKTKIAQESNTPNTSITAVYLNPTTSLAEIFSPADNIQVFNVVPYLADETCTVVENIEDPATPGVPLVLEIPAGSSNATGNMLVSNTSSKERFMKMILIDSSSLSVEGQSCILNSSTTGNFARIAQCANSEVQYLDAFGTDAWDRCGSTNGEPCLSQNHGFADPSSPSYNPLYDNELGCYMCTFDIQPVCTTDSFAIRPNNFVIESSNTHMPDLLRAGSDYNVSINAYDYDLTTNSIGYNQEDSNLTIATVKWDNSPRVVNIALNGTATLGDFNITDGLSSYNGVSGEVASFSYTDVGYLTVGIIDQNWAAVDINDVYSGGDTTLSDCSADGGYVCGDKNVTFIPHHFSFKDVNMTNNNGLPGTYTYLSNLDDANQSTFGMSARIQTTIVAQNEANDTTLNFKTGSSFYENPVFVESNVTSATHGEANTTTIIAALLGFTDGEHNVTWNNANLSSVLRFNFPRSVSDAMNPFTISPSDMNLSTKSIYSQPVVTGYDSIANVEGEEVGLGDGGATMIYGRTNAKKQTYTTNSGTALIYYEAFCDGMDAAGVACVKSLLPNGVNSTTTNDPRWFINPEHNASTSPIDGFAGSVNQKGSAVGSGSVRGTTATTSTPASTTITYVDSGSKGYPYKTTMENNATNWLIYDKYDVNASKNKFDVEFLGGSSNWAGIHETNTTTIKRASDKTNRRTTW